MVDNAITPNDTAAPTAVVIGGNFGGLAAAIALTRAGIQATVYERAPELELLQRAKGGLHMWPNAVRALDVLGAAERVKAVGVEFTDCQMLSDKGRPCGTWPLAELEGTYGYPVLQVKRTALHKALLETFREVGAQARGGAVFTGFTQHDGGVTARFQDGSEVRADLLIGADGLKSVVRDQVSGQSPMRFGGLLISGLSDTADNPMPVGTMHIYYGEGSQFGIAKLADNETSWFVRTRRLGEDQVNLPAVKALFDGWIEPIGLLLDTTDPDSISSAVNFDRKPITSWGVGRITLLGDAAHPMLNSMSQGAAQAIEDAAVLQRVLTERGLGDLPGALRDYEQRRIKRTAMMVSRSRMLGALGLWQHPWLREVRDRLVLPSRFAWRKASEAARPAI